MTYMAQASAFIPTLNKMGFMTAQLDSISAAFVDFSSTCNAEVLEVGAAYGVATRAALASGARVVCNDLDFKHLSILRSTISIEEQNRLLLAPGDFPDEVKFQPNQFGAILICRVLHFFDGDKIERVMRNAYEYLKPGGKLFIVADTPYLNNLRSFIPVFEQRQKENKKWPGVIQNVKQYTNIGTDQSPSFINALDDITLSRILSENNFKIDLLRFFFSQRLS